jgi:hypothetical protein
MKTIYKILIWILILVLIWEYYYFVEKKAIEIDKYNFQQLEKAKQVVENFEKSWKRLPLKADDLPTFNTYFVSRFWTWKEDSIEPLDKRYCYYVYYDRDTTWSWYIFEFWFKLHSLLYKLKYLSFNYAYPKQIEKEEPSEACKEELKLPYLWLTWMPACAWLNASYYRYLRQINNPCRR